jgi:hypothetical protein
MRRGATAYARPTHSDSEALHRVRRPIEADYASTQNHFYRSGALVFFSSGLHARPVADARAGPDDLFTGLT